MNNRFNSEDKIILAIDGLDGCVCSPWEVKMLRSIYKDNFELITPGIRLKIDSQKVINPDLVFNSKNDLEGKILQIGKKIIKRFEN